MMTSGKKYNRKAERADGAGDRESVMTRSIAWEYDGKYVGRQSVGYTWVFTHVATTMGQTDELNLVVVIEDITDDEARVRFNGVVQRVVAGDSQMNVHYAQFEQGDWDVSYEHPVVLLALDIG